MSYLERVKKIRSYRKKQAPLSASRVQGSKGNSGSSLNRTANEGRPSVSSVSAIPERLPEEKQVSESDWIPPYEERFDWIKTPYGPAKTWNWLPDGRRGVVPRGGKQVVFVNERDVSLYTESYYKK